MDNFTHRYNCFIVAHNTAREELGVFNSRQAYRLLLEYIVHRLDWFFNPEFPEVARLRVKETLREYHLLGVPWANLYYERIFCEILPPLPVKN